MPFLRSSATAAGGAASSSAPAPAAAMNLRRSVRSAIGEGARDRVALQAREERRLVLRVLAEQRRGQPAGVEVADETGGVEVRPHGGALELERAVQPARGRGRCRGAGA